MLPIRLCGCGGGGGDLLAADGGGQQGGAGAVQEGATRVTREVQ